ncbi:CopD family protein [Radiobacillus kanasensis]|uniref:copper resistance D family protein n=1 Tax=Radiobacillus kanasensis TaxID=2844358 RepID=UPI001E610062|nr:CopD family protein [Radiobacillus kanasensis]UFU00324.1 CopD family protein [Radiobacillus kanasensis]
MESFTNSMVILTEVLLYVSFAILMGSLILMLLPATSKPPVWTSKGILMGSTLLIPILSLFPILELTSILGEGIGFMPVFTNILSSFEVGKAWTYTLILSVVLLVLFVTVDVKKNKTGNILAIGFTVLLVLATGYAGHASSITDWSGFFAHSFHFLAVVVWSGVVLVASWFSRQSEGEQWKKFVSWFTPLAIVCLVVLIIAGFFTMKIDINSYDDVTAPWYQEYRDSLLVNYGQSLLIKHLLFVPLLVFAFINAFIIKRRVSDSGYNPIKWLRAESVFILFVLIATAFMGNDYPPHQINTLIQTSGASPLFNLFHTQTVQAPVQVGLQFELVQYVLFGLAAVSAIMMIRLARKETKPTLSFVLGILFVISTYIAVITGLSA